MVYGLWNGYKEEEQYKKFLDRMEELGIDVIDGHTSGHADYTAFKQLFDITKPNIVIPIHTEDKYKIKEYTDRAYILDDMETLEINEKGECKIVNNIETRRKNPANYLTLDKLLGYHIKEKYLKAPLEEDLNNPIIQMQIIKHFYYEELFNSIDIITDRQVITEILTNRMWQKPNLKLYEGTIQNIKITKEYNSQVMDIELKDNKTKLVYEIKGYLFTSNKGIELYKSKVLEPNKDNIIAVVEVSKDYYPRLLCFMKSYSSANIESTYNTYQKYLEELPTIWNEDCSSIENVPDNIIKVIDSNIKKYVNNEMARNYIVNGVMRTINDRQVIDTITNEEIVSLVEEYKARYHIIDRLKSRFNQYSKELNKEPDNLIMVHFFELVYKRNLYKCSTYSELKDLIKKLYEVQGGVKYVE